MKSGGLSAPLTTGWGASTPPELLLQVLRHFAPGAPQYNTERVDRDYMRERSYFAKLRLVCKAWDGPVLDLLFRTTLLFMRGSDENTRRNLMVLDHHPNLIQTLTIVTKRGGGRGIDHVRVGFEKKIGGRLGFCSKLRKLILAEGDFIFLDRRWVQKTCPGLTSTVTSLKLASVTKKTCSLALAGFGRNLTSLEVSTRVPRHGPENGPIHLPSIMPYLSRLT
ncbi:hypothetical protein BD779DRAFT_517206 [Infundibulicybe gibba]|nr:hypothetical protein BD779DRAFT_517206 [Infundibulicybe gibba]